MAKRPPLPFGEIASHALSAIHQLLHQWLPHGHRHGHEYRALNPLRADSSEGSFSINLNTGEWGDFATDDKGRDLISLYAYLNGLENYDAGVEVADQIGFAIPDACRNQDQPVERKAPIVDPAKVKAKEKAEDEWEPVYPDPIPDGMEPHKAHIKRGLPSNVYTYRDANQKILGYVYRFITSDGGKETIPHTLWRHKTTGQIEFKWRTWPEGTRPLYGLDRLAKNPDAYVLLVEGEKCVDYAIPLVSGVPVTWPGGSQAVDKSDWSPLAGRKIYAWADCDAKHEPLTKEEKANNVDPLSKPLLPEKKQPGMKAMLQIYEILHALDPSTEFHLIDIPAPGDKPDGWDIADAIDEGMNAAALTSFITGKHPRISLVVNNTEIAKQPQTPTTANASDEDEWRPYLNTKRGELVDCRENVFLFLSFHPRLKGLVGFDMFSLRIVKLRAAPWDKDWHEGLDWQDDDNLELGLWLSSREGYLVRGVDTIFQGVKLAASRNKFDPVIDYFESLQWDGISRARTWLTDFAGCRASEYIHIVGIKFLLTIVARAYKPGCQMRTMVVLEGPQYRGKSSILRILGGRWFSDSPLDLKGKDGFINIQGILINEIAELGSFNNHDSNVIKSYLSSATDRFRSPFDKFAKDYPRRTVLTGTTNEDEYLKDKTGNSRFWPVRTEEVGDIDLEGLAEAKDLLFAEAVHLFKSGEPWHISADQQRDIFEPEQRLREHDDPWEGLIRDWLDKETFNSITVARVLIDCLRFEPSKITPANSSTVGKILTRIGWKQSRPSDQNSTKRQRVYLRPGVDLKAITSNVSGDDDEPIPF